MLRSCLIVPSVIVTGLLLCGPMDLQAMMVGLSTKQLTIHSELVLVGRVEQVESHWNADETMILTTAQIAVEEVLKGDVSPGKTVTVTCEGGEVGDIGLKVSDSATFTSGEKVVVFLESETKQATDAPARYRSESEGTYNLVGKAQGKYTVDESGIAGKKGFSLAGSSELVENNIPLGVLIEKIKREVQ